ncbi:MAG TPA: dihydrolipoamide acetyltransferase family protein [Candidatus Acidoferrum sp.]|nr:dihydrolipoamide acetyltransferase family protein [Candidatus Acidoferrum sp.]
MGEFVMPSLGADMEAGILVEWLKRPGETVTRGDIVAVVETDKGAIEVEIFEDAIIDRLLVDVGTKVPVGTPLASLRTIGQAGAVGPVAAAPPGAAAPKEQATPLPPPSATIVRPAARPAGMPAAGDATRPYASPAARRIALERGVDLSGVIGSGPGGAVISIDVEKAAGATKPRAAERGPDLAAMRRAIGAAMARSKREIPHYYLSRVIDLTKATAWLESANAPRAPAERLLLQVLTLRAVALALRSRPGFNGFHTATGFRPSERIHIGTAVAIRGGGLVAPAIHDVDRLTLDELMGRLRDLVARVRAGTLRSSELTDPTVTVSSLGERGADALFGIIYPPQVAILGFGAPALRPWVVGSAIEPRTIMTASLAADHRVTDGHAGSLLLADLDRLLQQPAQL